MEKVVASVPDEIAAEMICKRLAEADIPAVYRRNSGAGFAFGGGGACDVYVEEADVERAGAALESERFSDEELADLSERDPAPDE